MRTLKIIEHVSLDGVVQHSADENDFAYGEWTLPYRTPDGGAAVMAAQGESFDLLLGRRSYDIWSAYWPTAPSGPIGDPINAATKYVATHRPESLGWGPSEGVGPDPGRGRPPHQVLRRSGSCPVGQLDADLDAAREQARGRGPADHLPGLIGHGQAVLRGRDPRLFTRTGRRDDDLVWCRLCDLSSSRAADRRLGHTRLGGQRVPSASGQRVA